MVIGSSHTIDSSVERAGLTRIDQLDLSQYGSRTWSIVIARLAKRLARDPRCLACLFEARRQNRIFAATIIRIWLAYRTQAMRYGIFTLREISAFHALCYI